LRWDLQIAELCSEFDAAGPTRWPRGLQAVHLMCAGAAHMRRAPNPMRALATPMRPNRSPLNCRLLVRERPQYHPSDECGAERGERPNQVKPKVERRNVVYISPPSCLEVGPLSSPLFASRNRLMYKLLVDSFYESLIYITQIHGLGQPS
jgi:hypothetical protein